ncbi:MAG: hypothetical protein HZB56_08310 [Deltaproteobacteria bacterium]|nr:hypothetical protein [Deltaproteobacteria bacterium]
MSRSPWMAWLGIVVLALTATAAVFLLTMPLARSLAPLVGLADEGPRSLQPPAAVEPIRALARPGAEPPEWPAAALESPVDRTAAAAALQLRTRPTPPPPAPPAP